MTPAERYLHHRREADQAFALGDGAATVAHAAAAHTALMDYAAAYKITTDEAAARIRREEKRA